MSGRSSLAASRSLSLPFASYLLLMLSVAPALAQTVADPPQAPLAPSEPPVAPPAPDPPPPPPSEPAPPSQAPPITEPTPAPTLTPAATPKPAPESPATDAAPPSASPESSAAFAPLPEPAASPKPQSTSMPRSAAAAPAAAASREASPAAANSEPQQDDDSSGGLLGPFRIGVLVGTGLPEVLSFGAQLKLTSYFGAGVNVGLIPTVHIKYYGEAAQSYQEYDVYGHIYPFGGSFFLGAGVGYAQIDGTLYNRFRVSNVSVDVTSDATVRTLVLTPQIGFLKIFDIGFAVGFDVGAQIPIAPSQVDFHTVTVGIPPELSDMVQQQYINPNDEKVRNTLNTLGRTPLPTVNFKLGWFL